jgi:hypothetical protein
MQRLIPRLFFGLPLSTVAIFAFVCQVLSVNADCHAQQPVGKPSEDHAIRPVRHAFFVAGPSFTGIIDEHGETQWAAPKAGARDGWVLPNGHLLIAWQRQAIEFGSNKQVVWTYDLQSPNRELGTVQRLANGNTLVTELGPTPRLREITSKGEAAVDLVLQPETDNAHMQTRMARKLPNGDYLVPHLLAHAVKRYQPNGKVVEVIRTDRESLGGRKAENWPFTAIRLDNGNTLIGCTHGDKVIEVDSKAEVVWSVDNQDLAGIIHDACGVQRLPNGNTVIAAYAAKTGAKLIEVTRQKRIVWSYDGPHRVHHFQILTTNGEPLPGPTLR